MRLPIIAAAVAALCILGGVVEAKKDKKVYRAVKSDVKYIKCQVGAEVQARP